MCAGEPNCRPVDERVWELLSIIYHRTPFINRRETYTGTFGAITSATDPVAVVALLEDLGASPGLTMAITGESLFNDGTAMVFFWLFLSLAKDHQMYASSMDEFPGEVVVFFLRMVIGGTLIGLA